MMDYLPIIQEAADTDRNGLTRIRRQLLERLTPAPNGYWIDHSHFGKGIPQHGAALIGQDRASDIIINMLLPIALVWAEESQSATLRGTVECLYDSYPKLQENHITQQIESQISTDAQPIKLIVPSAKKQQGAIYLHKHFCSKQLCDLCPIINGGGVDD